MAIANSTQKKQKDTARVWRNALPILLAIGMLLTSCSRLSQRPNETALISTNTSTVSTPQTTTSPTIEATPTFTPTITPTPTFLVNSQCPALSNSRPAGLAKGIVSFWGRNRTFEVLLNLENGQKSLLPGGNGAQAIVSQDRNMIAYSEHDPNTLAMSLVVHVLNEDKKIEIPWPSSRGDLSRWQDNTHLLFTDYSTDPPYAHFVLNPFTDEKILLPDFPNVSDKLINWERAGSAVYDQTLEYVVYAAWDEALSKHEYVLWHIPSQTEMAILPGNSYGGYSVAYAELIPIDGVSYNPPVWSTADTRVAVISSAPDNSKVDEIFTMDKDGNIQQLTEFSNQFEQANIRTLSWSPDGKMLAFFITTEPGSYRTPRNEQLAILDTMANHVTIYCIDGDVVGTRAGMFIGDDQQTPAPLWSPDGSQLIIENRYGEDASRLILFDIASHTAYEVGQNMQPIGWMLREP